MYVMVKSVFGLLVLLKSYLHKISSVALLKTMLAEKLSRLKINETKISLPLASWLASISLCKLGVGRKLLNLMCPIILRMMGCFLSTAVV